MDTTPLRRRACMQRRDTPNVRGFRRRRGGRDGSLLWQAPCARGRRNERSTPQLLHSRNPALVHPMRSQDGQARLERSRTVPKDTSE